MASFGYKFKGLKECPVSYAFYAGVEAASRACGISLDEAAMPEFSAARMARYIRQKREQAYPLPGPFHFYVAGLKWFEAANGVSVPALPARASVQGDLFTENREKFLNEIAVSIASLPQEISKLLNGTQYKIIAGRTLRDIDPVAAKTFPYAVGFHSYKEILMAQAIRLRSAKGSYVLGSRTFKVCCHELGHAVDELLPGSSSFSLSPEFMSAYNRDLKLLAAMKSGAGELRLKEVWHHISPITGADVKEEKISRNDSTGAGRRRQVAYFLERKEGGVWSDGKWRVLRETFAESFGSMISGCDSHENFRATFPNCVAFVKQLSDAIQNEMNLKHDFKSMGMKGPVPA